MTPELLGEAIVDFAFLAVFLGILGIGALIADYVFPHIPFIQRYLDRLPDYEDDEEVERSTEKNFDRDGLPVSGAEQADGKEVLK